MIDPAIAVPLAVAALALLGVTLGVSAKRQENRGNDQTQFMTAMAEEVRSLRAAQQFGDTRISEIMTRLQKAQMDILTCTRERNDLAAKVSDLQRIITDLTERHRAP